jgi:hypothetical protein
LGFVGKLKVQVSIRNVFISHDVSSWSWVLESRLG